MATRCGVPYPDLAASAWTSTSTGRVPSINAVTALPLMPAARAARKTADGLGTAISPDSVMEKTPSSSTEPKRFLVVRSRR